MRRKPSDSARTVALATVFCALGIAFGCGRERFDLLSDASLVSAGRAGSAGVGNGGTSGSAGKASGGAGKGGESSEQGGVGGVGGVGGRLMSPSGGFSPCLGDGGCQETACPEALPFCPFCRDNDDCFKPSTCQFNRCVECRVGDPCGTGLRCNPTTLRCTRACTPGKDSNETCGGDQRSICSEDGVCVSCSKDTDCYGYPSAVCYLNICVECYRDDQCLSQERCFHGHCIPRD